MVFVRNEFNYEMGAASLESALDCSVEPSKAKQSFRDECDINVIAKRFGLLGEIPQGVRMPSYEDFTEVLDFQSAMNAIRSAQESFNAMPPEVRSRFNNDPGLFVDFCSNEENRQEAIKLGLVPSAVADLAPASPPPGGTPGGPVIASVEPVSATPKGAA